MRLCSSPSNLKSLVYNFKKSCLAGLKPVYPPALARISAECGYPGFQRMGMLKNCNTMYLYIGVWSPVNVISNGIVWKHKIPQNRKVTKWSIEWNSKIKEQSIKYYLEKVLFVCYVEILHFENLIYQEVKLQNSNELNMYSSAKKFHHSQNDRHCGGKTNFLFATCGSSLSTALKLILANEHCILYIQC